MTAVLKAGLTSHKWQGLALSLISAGIVLTPLPLLAKAPAKAVKNPQPAKYSSPAPSVKNLQPKGQSQSQSQPGPDFSSAYKAYGEQLRAKIYSKWMLPDGNNHVTITMTVSTDGSVSELSLASEPKSTEAEQAANDAFNQVQPLPALPSGANGAKLTLKFDSQASQHATNSNLTTQLDPIVSKSPAASTGDSTQATDNK